MRDKALLKSTEVPPENLTPNDGTYPEQQPKKFPTLRELLNSIGIQVKDMNLYYQAFTHASYSNEHRGNLSYDRLEFLGDGVLDLVVGDLLYRAHVGWDSGKLSKARAQIVEGHNLSDVAVSLGFAPYVRFSVGERMNAAYHLHIFEDVFEAFIGALYLEQGYDAVYRFIASTMAEYITGKQKAGVTDWKSKLQEEIQAEFKSGVTYQIVSETGPAQDKLFTAICMVDGVILGTGRGHNKKQAETEAAKEALLARKRD